MDRFGSIMLVVPGERQSSERKAGAWFAWEDVFKGEVYYVSWKDYADKLSVGTMGAGSCNVRRQGLTTLRSFFLYPASKHACQDMFDVHNGSVDTKLTCHVKGVNLACSSPVRLCRQAV